MANLAEHSNTTASLGTNLCPPFPSARLHSLNSNLPYMVNAAINAITAVTIVCANVLVLLAIRRSTSIRLPSKVLLCNLVLTDLGVGLFVQPTYLVFLVTKAMKARYDITCFSLKCYGVLGTMLASASLLTMTAISFDRYVALFFHVKYHEILTIRRIAGSLIVIWSISLTSSSSWLWSVAVWDLGILIGFAICFPLFSWAYVNIYRRLRRQNTVRVGDQSVAQQQPTSNKLDVVKYKRTASTMLCIYVLFILCYLPVISSHLVITFVVHSALAQCIFEFTLTLVHMNSLFNALVYCVRLPEIRTEVIKDLRKLCKFSLN